MSVARDDSNGVKIRFFHESGRMNIRHELDRLLNCGISSIQAAVCFFREPGVELLKRHAARLNQPDSFFVVCIAKPTDLSAVQKLHELAPGHTYLHFGAVLPKERGTQRPLMHSKVFLATCDDSAYLWVGSHNMTASALQGVNFEAALGIEAATNSDVISCARSHLLECQRTAHVFDPTRMDEYQDLQGCPGDTLDEAAWITVIHAEAEMPPRMTPFVAHVRLIPTEFDAYFPRGVTVHLYLYERGTLHVGDKADVGRSAMYVGKQTAFGTTEHHPANAGRTAEYAGADYQIDIPNLNQVPQMRSPELSGTPRSQALIRFDGRASPFGHVYSLSRRSMVSPAHLLGSGQPLPVACDPDMIRFFNRRSVDGDALLYDEVTASERKLSAEAYRETFSDWLGQTLDPEDAVKKGYKLAPVYVKPEHNVDPFFFVSRRYFSTTSGQRQRT